MRHLYGMICALVAATGLVGSARATPFPIPSTQIETRCWAGPLFTDKYHDPCFRASSNFSTLSASDSSPYPINIHLEAESVYGIDQLSHNADGSPVYDFHGPLLYEVSPGINKYVGSDVGAAAFTQAYSEIVLTRDLPANFGPIINVPISVSWSKSFSVSTFGPHYIPVNAAKTEDEYRADFISNYMFDFYKRIPYNNPDFHETGFITGNLVQDQLFDTSFNTEPEYPLPKTPYNMDWAAGVAELNVAGVTLVDSIMFSHAVQYGLATINLPIATSFFGHEGDAFLFETKKGAACLASIFNIEGQIECDIAFDPVISFDQAAFDAANGANSFNLADYFALVTSVGPAGAVPEPEAWALMIAGIGLVGAMKRRQARRTATPALRSA